MVQHEMKFFGKSIFLRELLFETLSEYTRTSRKVWPPPRTTVNMTQIWFANAMIFFLYIPESHPTQTGLSILENNVQKEQLLCSREKGSATILKLRLKGCIVEFLSNTTERTNCSAPERDQVFESEFDIFGTQ